MNKIVPNALASFAHLNVDLGDAVNPFLQPPAVEALKQAIARRPGKKMFVNSAYRTIAQQLLLFNQGQRGQCGIGLVASPGGSNHQSGLALDIDDDQGWIDALEAEGWRWLGPNDPPHFDYVGGGTKDIRGAAILAFQKLWNKHNPGDLLAEDSDFGTPGLSQTEKRLNRSPIDGFGGFAAAKTVPGATARVLELQTPLMEGEDVRKVQEALLQAKFDLGENGADGLYGVATANAVQQFQQQKGLTLDGQVGSKTLAALGLDVFEVVRDKDSHSVSRSMSRLVLYPYLECPEATSINEPFSVFVQLLLRSPESHSRPIQAENISASQLPEVEVVMRAINFDIEVKNFRILVIERMDDSEVRFVLIPRQLNEQKIQVDFYQYGRRIGTVCRTILVTENSKISA